MKAATPGFRISLCVMILLKNTFLFLVSEGIGENQDNVANLHKNIDKMPCNLILEKLEI